MTDAEQPGTGDDDVVVMAVTDETEVVTEEGLQTIADENRERLTHDIAAVQEELAGMARTGVPGVDAAMALLAEMDPADLEGSAEVMGTVLAQLESVLRESPQE